MDNQCFLFYTHLGGFYKLFLRKIIISYFFSEKNNFFLNIERDNLIRFL